MADHPLIQYIKDARRSGLENSKILEDLTASGWRLRDVFDLMLEHVQPATQADSSTVPSSVDDIISVRNVSKLYGQLAALDNVSLNVRRGGVTALLGPNGAGKTTLVRAMTTLLTQDYGDISVAGLNTVHQAQELRSIIGLAGQYAAVDEVLTGRENLEMVGRLYHLNQKVASERAVELLRRFDLEDAADRPLSTYSGGMRRRLDLAASLVIKPKVLFLDEPTTGLDPRSRFELWHIIRDLVADGTTVLLTTQYLEEADQLANYIFVIDHGRIIAQGTADELKRQIGGDVLELHVADISNVGQAANIIREFGEGEPQPDTGTGIITMPIAGGASVLADVIRRLDGTGIKVRDVILRRPSLDDVFMKLTGHTTGN